MFLLVIIIHVNERCRRKKEASKVKTKQHNTPKVVTFPNKNELPRVGLEPMTLHSRLSALPRVGCLSMGKVTALGVLCCFALLFV